MKKDTSLSIKQARYLQNRAQSFTETIIALALFISTFIFFFVLVNNYLKSLREVRERIIAQLLAQEGIELVIAKRNQSIAQNKDWPFNLLSSTTTCVDYDLETTTCGKLYLDGSKFTYRRTGRSTAFSRTIELAPVTSSVIQITSKVEWQNNKVELESIITKWHPNQP